MKTLENNNYHYMLMSVFIEVVAEWLPLETASTPPQTISIHNVELL